MTAPHDLLDLRRTLDAHAHDLTDTRAHERAAAVRGRVRTVRRRRAAGVVAAAVLGVGTATGVTLLPGADTAPPATAPTSARAVMGQEAPPSLESLGWTYEFTGLAADRGEASVRMGLERSDRPRLVSWMTSGEDQDVEVRLEDGERWVSAAGDFEDFMWVPPGYEGEVRVEAGRPGVAVAVYEVDETQVPAGVSRDGVVFREQAGDRSLVGARVGERGQTDVSFDFEAPEGTLSIVHTCSGLPRGYSVHISLTTGNPGGLVIGACEETFDPGASPSSSFPGGLAVPAGDEPRARIWVTKGMDSEPVDPADFPDAQLGLGLYAFDRPPARVAGMEAPQVVESRGRLWQLEDVAETRGAELRVEPTGSARAPHLATVVRDTRGTTSSRLSIEDASGKHATDGDVTHEGGGRSATPELYLAPGTRAVTLEVLRGQDEVHRLGIAVYRLIG
jgi:hypothetical protein